MSETKLKKKFPYKIYSLPGFHCFACPRERRGGGGILVFITKLMPVEKIELSQVSYERLHLIIHAGELKFRLLAFYRAPESSNYQEFIDELEIALSSSETKTMIVGDINIGIPNLSVRTQPDEHSSKIYLDLLSSYGYSVTNLHPTRPLSGKTIDHFATNFHNIYSIKNDTIEIDPSLSDHSIIISSIDCETKLPRQRETMTRKKLNTSMLSGNLPAISETLSASKCANQIANQLTSALQLSIERSTTTYYFKVKHSERICEWASAKSLKLLALKDKFLRKRRAKPLSVKIRNDLFIACGKLTDSIKNDYTTYVSQQVSSRDPKKMWRGLNKVMGRKSVQEIMSIRNPASNVLESDAYIIATLFNDYFCSCNSTNAQQNSTESQFVESSPQKSMGLLPTDVSEVLSIIGSLRNDCASGIDGIGPRVLKCLGSTVAPLIVTLVNVIFSSGVYPTIFKTALVTPIFKGGSQFCLENYRPVSVLPILNKVVEKIFANRLNDFASKNKILFCRQFGFRKGASTEAAAAELTNSITHALDAKLSVTGVFMDLRKAFDLVDHEILLEVLRKYGVRGCAIQPIISYLSERRQIVKVGASYSEETSISNGVIQGSCLGPLLFLLFINAVGSLPITGEIYLFADDAILLNRHNQNDPDLAREILIKDMTLIANFFAQRRLILNVSKTNFMLFTTPTRPLKIGNKIEISSELIIERVLSAKYLGLVVNETLSWVQHIEAVRKKIAPAAGVLWKLRNVLPLHSRKLVYDALVQSHLSYMITIWGFAPFTALSETQVLQNRSLRNVHHLHPRTSRSTMYMSLVDGRLPLRGMCVLNTATFIHNALSGQNISNLPYARVKDGQDRQLRNANDLRSQTSHSTLGNRAIDVVGPKIYNKVPKTIKSIRPIRSFRRAFQKHLHTEDFITSCFNKSFLEFKF